MTDNIPARAATSPELVNFRAGQQATKLGLAIQHPATVYTARVNQTFTSTDGIAELTYDGGSGTLAEVLQGMTVYIGSSAGYYDKGICRVRQIPTADKFYISQTSDIQFADNDYITVINSVSIWQRDITNIGGIIAMDYDIQFGDIDNGGAIPRIGPLAAVLKLVAGTVTFAPPDPSLSACYDGAAIVSYLYDAPGAASTADMDTTAPSWTYDTAGEYRWSCAITDDQGRVTTAYRWVFVDPAAVDFNLESCSGDYGEGDWSFEVTCYSGVTRADVVDRAMVTLYADADYYGGVKGSIGKIAGYENILCSGWIDGESISFDAESGEVAFTVRGAGYWLSKIRAFPFELSDVSGTPSTWKEITEMTVDKALAHILYWTSTAPIVMDCFFSGDVNRHKILAQPSGSLKDQINAIASDRIFAKPLVNNYGQMFVEVDSQIISSADRSALPVVMDIMQEDWLGGLDIERVTTAKTSMIEFSAITSYDGTTASPIYARAPGVSGKIHGDINSYDNYVVADQSECNRIAGALLAMENNEYEPIEIKLSANNRLLDIAPRMVCTLTVNASDTPRGIEFTSARIIPRQVNYEFDKDNNVLVTTCTFEFETTGIDGVTYVPPTPVVDNVGNRTPGLGGVDFPGFDSSFPSSVPPEVTTPCISGTFNQYSLTWSPTFLVASDPSKLIAKLYFPCKLRSAMGFNSYLDLDAVYYGDAASHFTVYAVKDGGRILTATVTSNSIATFTPMSDTEVDGFELELDADSTGSSVVWTDGSFVYHSTSAGTVTATLITPKTVHYHVVKSDDVGAAVQITMTVEDTTDGYGFKDFKINYTGVSTLTPDQTMVFKQNYSTYYGDFIHTGLNGAFNLRAKFKFNKTTIAGVTTVAALSDSWEMWVSPFPPHPMGELDIYATIDDGTALRMIALGNAIIHDVCKI